MRQKYLLFSFASCLCLAVCLAFIHKDITQKRLESLVKEQLASSIYKKYFSLETIDFGKEIITIHTKPTRSFLKLKLIDTYVLLDTSQKGLGYQLKQTNNPLFLKDIRFSIDTDKGDYLFKDTFPNRDILYIRNGFLTYNDLTFTLKNLNNSPEFIDTYITPLMDEKASNGTREFDIMQFMDKNYKVMTNNYTYIRVSDEQLMMDWASEEFNISKKEIKKIYLKWNFTALLEHF
ncbi:hypothetical protein [Bacillus sp. 1P06AnD]|uniref:hypothetical protein n=1 Tax=Bacillus sp. 1P06AnD TaxID=3132208 RepID=UPI0039A21BF8